jgi:hypothetical protein
MPPSARLASVEFGLWRGTGEMVIVDVAIKVIASKHPGGKADAK